MIVLSGTFLDSRDERNDELLVLGVLGENKTLLSLLVAGSIISVMRSMSCHVLLRGPPLLPWLAILAMTDIIDP